jgi:predicted kinase
MAWRAVLILSSGSSVVADAVFDREADRKRIERAAKDRALSFLGIWLDAAPDMLWQRVTERKGGPSDATVDILSRQLQRDPGKIAWQRLDAARDPAETVETILEHLAKAQPDSLISRDLARRA